MKSEKERACGLLVALCAVCYFVSYVTRINYGAVILEIENAEGISKVEASMAVTGSFITYGAGQLVSGWLGDKRKPEKLIFAGLLLSALMNGLVPVFAYPAPILIFWCINGFAQALIWPPMVKILSAYLDDQQYKKGCVRVAWGSSVGTIMVYLFAPVCIMWKGWKSLFILCGGIALCFCVLWNRTITAVETRILRLETGFGQKGGAASAPAGALGKENEANSLQKNETGSRQEIEADSLQENGTGSRQESGQRLLSSAICLLLIPIMLSIVMQGALRDGITTWMPSYVSETYHLDSSISILSGVLLPVFSIFSMELASVLNRKVIRNEMACAGAIFLGGFAGALMLSFFPASGALFSVLLAALVTACMHGVNVILVSMVPPYFRKSGHVSTVSGVLNSCTYVGSALSSYGFAQTAQQSGWQTVIWLWVAASFVGAILCFGNIRRWRRFQSTL